MLSNQTIAPAWPQAQSKTQPQPQAKPKAKPKTGIEIYFKTWCPYSRKALALLSRRGVHFTGIDVTHDRVLEAEMVDRSGRTSVPQIFIDGEPVGGCDDLFALVGSGASGAFDRRLGLSRKAPRAA